MIVYYSIFLFLILLGILKTEFKYPYSFLFSIITIILFIIAAFRGNIGKDYESYIDSFHLVQLPTEYFTNYAQWGFFEPFYYFIPAIIKLVNPPFFEIIIFSIFACIGISANLLGIYKLSTFKTLSVVHYFSFFFLLHEMTQVRAGIACGLMLLCIYFYYHKRYFLYIFCFLTAFAFHYTSILILIILFLKKDVFRLKLNLAILVFAVIAAAFKLNVMNEILFQVNLPFIQKLSSGLTSLTEEENKINVFNIPFLLNITLTIWLFINHKIIYTFNKYAYLLLKVQLISIVCFGLFTSIAVIAFRLYEFFGIVNVITVTYIIYTLRNKYLGYFIIIIYSLLLLILTLHITKLVGPYHFIFFE